MNTFKRFFREAVLQPGQQATQTPNQGGGIVTQQPGATRNLPLSQGLVAAIQKGLAGTGLNWHSYSGGQPAKGSGGRRVGSTRHDNGRASDGYFKDAASGRILDASNGQDRQRISGALGKLRQSGIQGIGWGPGYMGSKNFHIDIVSPEIWGEGGRSANAHQWVVAAAGGSVAAPAGGTTPTGGESGGDGTSSLPPGSGENQSQSGGKEEFLNPQAAVDAAMGAIGQLASYGKGKSI